MNNRIRRILAALIDFYIVCFLSSVLVGIATLWKFDITLFSFLLYLFLFFMFLTIKDFIFKNASIGKRIFKIKIIKKDGSELTVIDFLKRTLPIIFLLPIELLLLIISDERIGDIWAKTQVTGIDKSENTENGSVC